MIPNPRNIDGVLIVASGSGIGARPVGMRPASLLMNKSLTSILVLFALSQSMSASMAATPVAPVKEPPKEHPCVAPRTRTAYKPESRCQNLKIGLETRTYRLYKPKLVGKNPLPVLLVLHGGGGSGSQMEELTRGQFNRVADQ